MHIYKTAVKFAVRITIKFGLLAVVAIAFGCSFSGISKRQIDAAEAKWKAAGIENYNYTFIIASLARDRECATPKVGIEVQVREGKLVKFGTCDLTVKKALQFGTIDAIFLLLHREKMGSSVSLEVNFDEGYGYPKSMDINYSRLMTDHRIQYYVSDFQVVK